MSKLTHSPRREVAGHRKTRNEIAAERRSQIIDAFIDCVRRLGIHGSTVEQVAKAASVSRTLIFHYFGDMDSLLQAALERIVSNSVYGLTLHGEGLGAEERRKRLVDFIVNGEHFQTPSDVVLMAELVSLGVRDPGVGDLARRGYGESIATKDAELAACFPKADPAARRAIAYALMCLSEMHWHFTAIGLGDDARAQDIRLACDALLGTLEKPAEDGT